MTAANIQNYLQQKIQQIMLQQTMQQIRWTSKVRKSFKSRSTQFN